MHDLFPIYRAFLYSNGIMTDLGFPTGGYHWDSAFANAINNNGDIVGFLGDSCFSSLGCSEWHAFIRKDGAMTDLQREFNPAWEVTESVANDINNAGDVIGNFYGRRVQLGRSGAYSAFLYQGGTVYNLPELLDDSGAGWAILEAYAINDAGSIVGRGYKDGGYRAVLLTPVPEPAAIMLLALGVVALCTARRPLASRRWLLAAGVVASIVVISAESRAVTIETVSVGNTGNPADVHPSASFGSVAYPYHIGTYEVTNAQYVEFLNAVDPIAINALALYNPGMSDIDEGGILRNIFAPNGSKYDVRPGRDNNPVIFVTWYDAVRFANWLHNGQGNSDTENGAYTLLGGTPTPSNANSISRNPGAKWFLPSENEWYKAAYHKNDGITGKY
jgi:probable HAF family extracellular repeat protein